MNQTFRFLLFLLLLNIVSFYPFSSAVADDDQNKTQEAIDISISPTDSLFGVTNMKPGDWAPRSITVKNDGTDDFNYSMHIKNSGENKLYNELLLEIETEVEELYNGKLGEFNSLAGRALSSGSEEEINITIRFPEHLGNDFQGLQAAFLLSFIAEGENNETVEVALHEEVASFGPMSTTGNQVEPPTGLMITLLASIIAMIIAIKLLLNKRYRRATTH